VLLIGDKGKILTGSYGSDPRFTSDSGAQEMPNPPKTLPRSPGHYVEWIRACQGESNTGANFDYAAPFTEWILLGNAALRAGQPIHWNGEEMKITNAPEANRFIRRPYREGWSL